MADEKAAETASAPDAPTGPKMIMGMPLLQFVFIVVNLLIMGGGLAFIIHASLIYKKPAITDSAVINEIKKKETARLKLLDESGFFTENYQEMTITLRGEQGGKTHYATLEMSLVCGSENCLSQLKENRAKVEDTVQTVMGARSYSELGSLEVKFRVKHDIMSKINTFLEGTAVTDVLFTNLLIQ
ncbi:MAG: flagellar basal body-associated FliL family protein [Bdellovibrionota bacterium]